MRYTPLSSDFYTRNRKRLQGILKPDSIVIVHSNDIMPANADGMLAFKQNSDLFYLCGIDQEETVLVLFPDAREENQKEMLFVRETNETISIWEGAKLTKEQATAASGIMDVHWLQDLNAILFKLMPFVSHVYLLTNEHTRAIVEVETRNARFIKDWMSRYPLHQYERLAPLMHQLRAIKQPEEIEALQTACDITEKGFRRILSFVKPGVMEYEIEAEFIHEFIRNGSRGFAYTPIIASGPSACVLHYVANDLSCLDGHLLLLDIGAEYGNYNADMTRCIPVNGKFSERQKEVYNAVLRVMRAASVMLVPGNTMKAYTEAVGKLMEAELIGLGLLKLEDVLAQNPTKPLYKKYFMHGTSHYLGLDVHDVGSFYRAFESGMVFTCEPGIYIPEEGLGIRIENNFLITENGPLDLMANIPIEVEELENLMRGNL